MGTSRKKPSNATKQQRKGAHDLRRAVSHGADAQSHFSGIRRFIKASISSTFTERDETGRLPALGQSLLNSQAKKLKVKTSPSHVGCIVHLCAFSYSLFLMLDQDSNCMTKDVFPFVSEGPAS